MQCVGHLHDPVTFGGPAPYADIIGALHKCEVVEWMDAECDVVVNKL